MKSSKSIAVVIITFFTTERKIIIYYFGTYCACFFYIFVTVFTFNIE